MRRPHPSRSTLQRLAWQLPLGAFFVLVLSLLPVALHTRALIEHEVWAAIDEEVLGLDYVHRQSGIEGLAAEIQHRMSVRGDASAAYLLVDAHGRRLAGNVDRWPANVPPRASARIAVDLGGRHLEGRVFALRGGARLLVANESPLRELERGISVALAVAGGLTLAVSSAISVLVLTRFRARLSGIGVAVERILENDPRERLPPSDDAELDLISREFNQVLDAMNRALDAVKHVSAAIAHDMRRPISALRYRLSEMDDDPRVAPEVKERIAAAIALTDETLASFGALLRLARIESDSYVIAREPVDLHALIEEVADTYQPVVDARGRALRTQCEQLHVVGDRGLLFQVLQNLLDNAINYGDGAIDIGARREGEQVRLWVRDHGPGVEEGLLPRLTDRFFRVDPARADGSSGIGLATVQAIVTALRGTLRIHNAHPGLAVQILLPAARTPAPSGGAGSD